MKLLYGFGINDSDYPVYRVDSQTKKTWTCPFYRKWSHMVERCYSEVRLEKYPSYTGCAVCEEWRYFSNFKAWMETQDWEGKSLDKDILSEGSKTYSPQTCIFISAELNNFLTFNKSNRGSYPPGVTYQKRSKKFRASVNHLKRVVYIGEFSTPGEAFLAWKTYKKSLILEILEDDEVFLLPHIVKHIDNAR